MHHASPLGIELVVWTDGFACFRGLCGKLLFVSNLLWSLSFSDGEQIEELANVNNGGGINIHRRSCWSGVNVDFLLDSVLFCKVLKFANDGDVPGHILKTHGGNVSGKVIQTVSLVVEFARNDGLLSHVWRCGRVCVFAEWHCFLGEVSKHIVF